MSYLKKIIVLSFVCIATACYSDMQDNNVPEWYVNPPKNDAAYLYGVGEGYNIDNASKVALKNLSSKLMVTISSKSELTRKENTYDYVEESNQKINEEVPNLTFNNYVVQKNEYKNGIIYVVVAVDRSQFINDNMKDLNRINARIGNLDVDSKNEHILFRRQNLIEINKLSKEAEKITRILGSLTSNVNTDKDIKNYLEHQKELDTVNDKIVFFVKEQQTPEEVLEVLKNEINANNIKLINSITTNINQKYLTILEVKTYKTTKQIYGTINTKLNIYLSLKDSQNKILASNQIEVSGSSVISEEQAIKSASTNLKNKISQKGIIEYIQNKW